MIYILNLWSDTLFLFTYMYSTLIGHQNYILCKCVRLFIICKYKSSQLNDFNLSSTCLNFCHDIRKHEERECSAAKRLKTFELIHIFAVFRSCDFSANSNSYLISIVLCLFVRHRCSGATSSQDYLYGFLCIIIKYYTYIYLYLL